MSLAEYDDWWHWFEYRADAAKGQASEDFGNQDEYNAMLARLDARMGRMNGPQRN